MTAFDSYHKRNKIMYDDGEEEWVALQRETFSWLTPRASAAGGVACQAPWQNSFRHLAFANFAFEQGLVPSLNGYVESGRHCGQVIFLKQVMLGVSFHCCTPSTAMGASQPSHVLLAGSHMPSSSHCWHGGRRYLEGRP